jgi:hypothetical protein
MLMTTNDNDTAEGGAQTSGGFQLVPSPVLARGRREATLGRELVRALLGESPGGVRID